MATTKISSNVLASGAALTNLNAGSSIAFTKSTSVSGSLTVDTTTLFVDNVNHRVGIGTTAPTATLHVVGTGLVTGALQVGTNAGANTFTLRDAIFSKTIGQPMTLNTGLQTDGTTGVAAGWTVRDTTNGMWSPALSSLAFSTASVERLRINSVGNVGIGTITPNEKLTVVGNVSATGTVTGTNLVYTTTDQTVAGIKTFSNNIVGNGTNNTLPNQTATTDDAILTRSLELSNSINYAWSNIAIIGGGEFPSTALMSQNTYYIAGSLNFSAGALSGYGQYLAVVDSQIYYPLGSGAANRFDQPFTICFEYDSNLGTGVGVPVDNWFIHGLDYNVLNIPTLSGSKCLAVKISHTNNTIEAMICAAGASSATSGAITLPTNFITNQSKRKICISWTGTTMNVYICYANASSFNPTTFSLIASVTAAGALPTAMTHYRTYFLSYLNADWPYGYIGVSQIADIKFIRKAVSPIL